MGDASAPERFGEDVFIAPTRHQERYGEVSHCIAASIDGRQACRLKTACTRRVRWRVFREAAKELVALDARQQQPIRGVRSIDSRGASVPPSLQTVSCELASATPGADIAATAQSMGREPCCEPPTQGEPAEPTGLPTGRTIASQRGLRGAGQQDNAHGLGHAAQRHRLSD